MAEITATNAQFDAALGNVPVPFGPATRAAGTDLDAVVIAPNSEMKFLCLSAASEEVMISYSELLVAQVRDRIFWQSAGMKLELYNFTQFTAAIDTITTDASTFDALALPDVDVQGFMRLANAISYLRNADNPLEAWVQASPWSKNPLNAAFTNTFVDPTVTIDTVTGIEQAGAICWSWGDGSYSWGLDGTNIPASHTYVGANTYTITLLAVGVYGEISTATDDVIVT